MGSKKQQKKSPMFEALDADESCRKEQGLGRDSPDDAKTGNGSAQGQLPGPPPMVVLESSHHPELTLEQLQNIYAASNVVEEATRMLATVLRLEDNAFDARNLILLDFCLSNLMFAKHAKLNLKQSLVIYDLGHMILDLIRARRPFADAERSFRNRLLTMSIIRYDPAISTEKQLETENQPNDTAGQKGTENINRNSAPLDFKLTSQDEKKKVGETTTLGGDDMGKPEEATKKKKQQSGTIESEDAGRDPNKLDEGNENLNKKSGSTAADEEPPLASSDLQKIVPYFTSTIFQHYCLYQYCLTREHYNVIRKERVLVETPTGTPPLVEATPEEEAARIAAVEEEARQHAFAAATDVRGDEQEISDALAMEGKRLAEEQLRRRAWTLDEYIELSIRQKIEDAKSNILEEYDYREYLLVDKLLQRQKEQSAKNVRESNGHR